MWTYEAPLREMRFVIDEVLGAPAAWALQPMHAELDADTASQVLEEAAKFAAEVLCPINSTADLEGCHWHDSEVTTPAGYRAAYRAFVDGGWPALACDPAYGGQGLPQLLNTALYEMLAASNHGWTMYPGLLHGAYECLKLHGSPALRERYLAHIVSGEWLSTMCLTEPQAGSDLGQVRTRAERPPLADGNGDGSAWRVSGSKIFISGGEHDLTDNILHLVLCRLHDGDQAAPPGSRGLSLLLCPKLLPDGTRNAIRCDGIEKKMGIKGSATCVLSFVGATGWLIGEPHRGLAAMFVMMNAARLHVGMQGLGHLEMATQNACRYANERLQLRAPQRPPGISVAAPTAAVTSDPIAWHPAMRRNLLGLQAMVQGGRVLAYWAALLLDTSHAHPDVAERQRAGLLTELLTPVVKAFLTHHGHQGAVQAQQVWGGYGYIHEYGIEQAVRDSRIAMVYEGTNEIQAIDLVQRKWLDGNGERMALLRAELKAEATRCAELPALADFALALQRQLQHIAAADMALRNAREINAAATLHVADDVMQGLGHALWALGWARTARAAEPKQADPWYAQQHTLARHGLQWLLPQAEVHWQRVAAVRKLTLSWVEAH